MGDDAGPGGRGNAGDPVAALAALVLDDPATCARLGVIEDVDLYVEAARAIAEAHGLALGEEAARAALRRPPPGMARFTPAPVTRDRWPGAGWLPARSVETGDAPAFDWLWFGDDPLADPFYEDAVRRFERRPFNRMFRTRTSAAALVAGAETEAADGPAPGGFIHHMSRCGSTLAARMLGAVSGHLVLSEPEPLDAAVRWAVETDAPFTQAAALLRAVVAALGRDRSGTTRRLFLKLDSWHAVALPLLRAAFPTTPWVVLFRDPVEVLVSQMRLRGLHAVPGMLPAAFLSAPDAEGMAAERYAALALARFMGAALDGRALGGGMAVDYADLPAAAADRIAPHFGWRPDAGERAAMLAAATRDAKAPERAFAPDGADKRREATPAVLAAARDHLDVPYAALRAWSGTVATPS